MTSKCYATLWVEDPLILSDHPLKFWLHEPLGSRDNGISDVSSNTNTNSNSNAEV